MVTITRTDNPPSPEFVGPPTREQYIQSQKDEDELQKYPSQFMGPPTRAEFMRMQAGVEKPSVDYMTIGKTTKEQPQSILQAGPRRKVELESPKEIKVDVGRVNYPTQRQQEIRTPEFVGPPTRQEYEKRQERIL